LDSRERRSPRLLPCQNPLPLLCFDHQHRRQPPMDGCRLCWPSSPTPPYRDTPRPPYARPGHRHGHRGHPIEAERHRPPIEPSPRRQTRLDPTDQFPEPATLDRDHAHRPVHVDVSRSGRPACPERASRSRAPRPRLTLLFTLTCAAR
jgi:hypothetical protein